MRGNCNTVEPWSDFSFLGFTASFVWQSHLHMGKHYLLDQV